MGMVFEDFDLPNKYIVAKELLLQLPSVLCFLSLERFSRAQEPKCCLVLFNGCLLSADPKK